MEAKCDGGRRYGRPFGQCRVQFVINRRLRDLHHTWRLWPPVDSSADSSAYPRRCDVVSSEPCSPPGALPDGAPFVPFVGIGPMND